jgi:hypothetical protein
MNPESARGGVPRSRLLVVLVCAIAAACSTSRRSQLQRVAKDWCETIRASQVIPVYPLTEDLQPGDVFLVRRPIAEQHCEYARRGFLPLDEHLERLQPDGYGRFYERSFDDALRSGKLPGSLQRPGAPREGGGTGEDSGADAAGAWQAAPGAAFPSYSFSVRRGGGLNLAVPVQGVPIGLALLGADAAEGSVALEDVRTLGVGTIALDTQLRAWARRPENRAFLANFGAESAPPAFLRVVTRVYVASRVDVSLRATSTRSGGVDAGKAAPIDLLQADVPDDGGGDTDAATGYAQGLAVVNGSLLASVDNVVSRPAGAFPAGGSLRVTAASQRAMSMKETFDPPLVFGYLGFDVAILPGGELGAPIPTLAVLDADQGARVRDEARRPFRDREIAVTRQLYLALRAVAADDDEAAEAVAALDGLVALVPDAATVYATGRGDVLKEISWPPDEPFSTPYLKYRDYRGQLRRSVSILDRLLEVGSSIRRATSGGGDPVTITPEDEAWDDLVAARDGLRRALEDPDVLEREREAAAVALRAFSRLAFEEDDR